MQKQLRPFLLTGLILSLLAYVVIFVSYIFSVVAVIGLLGDLAIIDTAVMLVIVMAILIMIFALLGLIFASVSISRWKLSPQEFSNRKGLIITTFVFNLIMALLMLISLFSEVQILTLVMLIVMIIAAVFIMVDVARNKKWIAQSQIIEQPKQQNTETNSEEK